MKQISADHEGLLINYQNANIILKNHPIARVCFGDESSHGAWFLGQLFFRRISDFVDFGGGALSP